MSITDELREWFKDRIFMGNGWQELQSIADRIDAEHEESIQREHESAYDAGYAEGMGVANKADMRAEYLRGKNDGYDEGWDSAAKTMTEHMVELPKDADGEPIRVGDVMEWPDGETFDVIGIGDGVLFYTESECGGPAEWTGASNKRHHHAPTVEDVLTEMFAKAIERGELTNGAAQTIAEYAAKLRLAKEEDA